MRYGRLSEDILNIKLYDSYDEKLGFTEVKVKDVLDEVAEDIICSDYETETVRGKLRLVKFTAWTRYTVFQLVEDGLDKVIIGVPRHPHSFIYRKK